jgi:hypothetical protein
MSKFRPDPKPEPKPKKTPQPIKRKKPISKKREPFSKQITSKQWNNNKSLHSKLEKILDHVFSKHIRKKGADSNGYNKCFTCPKRDHWKNLQCGHFITRNNRATRWDEDNCRPQCAECNMYKNGMPKEFAARLGQEMVMSLDIRSHAIAKFSSGELLQLVKKYETSLK